MFPHSKISDDEKDFGKCVTASHHVNANLDQVVTDRVVTAVLHQAIVFSGEERWMRPRVQPRGSNRISTNQPSSDPSTCPGNSSLAVNLVHYMNYLPKAGSKHSLYSWLPTRMNAGIYMNEACTPIDYTQSYSWLPSGMNAGIHTNEACALINYTQLTIWR